MRLTSLTRIGIYVALLGSMSACAEGDAPSEDMVAASAVALDPEVLIGQVEGDEAYTFGDIRAVAVDDDGRVYIGDRIGATVRVYSAQGAFIKQVAGEGQGPGEIQGWPADLTFGPEGALYVRDAARVSVFAPSGGEGIADDLVSEWRAPGYGNLTYARSRVSADGSYYYPDGTYRIGEPARFFYHIFRDGELTGDTLEVPYYSGMEAQRSAFYRVGQGGGRMVPGLSHVPFAAVPRWDVTMEGTVLSSDGNRAELLETGFGGDTVQVLAIEAPGPREVPPEERSDSLEALEARIDSLPVPIDQVENLGPNVADRSLPEVLPTTLSLGVGTDGRIWVERWPPEGSGESRFYDVYDSAGTHQAWVELRAPLVAGPPPFFGRHHVVGVVRDEATGIDRVVKFSHGIG